MMKKTRLLIWAALLLAIVPAFGNTNEPEQVEYLVRYSYQATPITDTTYHVTGFGWHTVKTYRNTKLVRFKAKRNAGTFEIYQAIRDYWRGEDWIKVHVTTPYYVNPTGFEVIFYSRTFSEDDQ